MKTFKKLFSVSAIVALLGTLAPMYAFGANYSEEEQEAYAYAYDKGITTMTSIDNANMAGTLTRIAMAKMIANYATTVLGLEPDTSKACTFSDVTAALDAQYDNGVTKACQLGLMGQGITAFRPNDPVTRGEFGTTLSRALNANDADKLAEMNAANPFYEKHLAYLKDAGIMNNISNPNMNERRGWVMIMMMRADEDYSEAREGCSISELLACLGEDDSAACMAACGEEPENPDEPLVVKQGTLNVSATSNNGANIFIEGISSLDTINLKASEEITVEKVTLERYGYVTHNTGITVWLEDENGVEIAKPKKMTEKTDEITLTISKDYRNALDYKAYTIVVSVDSGYKAAETLGFKVKDVTSSAETLKIASYTATTYPMVSYNGTDIDVEMKGKTQRYNYEEGTFYQVSKFRVKAGKSEVRVDGFTLNNTATTGLDLSKYVDSVEVKVGDKTLKLNATDIQKKSIQVTFNGEVIEAKGHADFTVSIKLNTLDDFGKAVELTLDQNAFKAVETKTSARIKCNAPTGTVPTYTFGGTKVKLENTKLGKVSAPRGKEDVVVAEGTLTLSESIEFTTGFTVATSGGFESLELWLNGSLIAEGETSDGENFVFNDVVLDKSGKLQFVADLYKKDDAANAAYSGNNTINISATFNKDTFATAVAQYEESGEGVNTDDIAGSISFVNVNIENTKGNLENTLTKKVEIIADGTHTRKTVFDGTYTAKKGTSVLNELTITGSALRTGEELTFYVTINGKSLVLDLAAAGNVDDTFSDITVEAGKSIDVKVEADIASNTTGELTYTLVLGGEDEDGLALAPSDADMVAIKLVKEGTVNIVSDGAKDLRLKENNIVLADFTVTAKESGTDLTSFVLSGVKGGDITGSNIRLRVANTDLDSDDYTLTSGGLLTVNDLNESIGTNGVNVKLILKTVENTGNYNIQLTQVNGSDADKEFSVKVVNALVRFTSQENNQGVSTKYTIAVEKSEDDLTVSELYYETSKGATGYLKQGTVTDGMTASILNDTSAAYIQKITYKVGNEPVELTRDNYEDYFKIGDDDLIVYSNK